MEKINAFIDLLLTKTTDVALIPYNPNPDKVHSELFGHFDKTDKNEIYSILLKRQCYDDESFEFALDTIKHYKGLFDQFDSNIEFDLYQKIKPYLTDDAIKRFQQHYFREYAQAILSGALLILETDLMEIILNNDIQLYISVAKKMNIPDAGRKIFRKNPYAIYSWFDVCSDPYAEMVALNEPIFILNNMSGRLSISPGSLKYIIEFTEPNRDLFLSIKRNVGLEQFLKLTGNNKNEIFFTELVETLDDLICVINTPDMSLIALEAILKTTKEKYPNIYDNLDSLLFVKKGFNINK